ncbi:hypothetical protein [Candidatus Protochlamydia sp. R18]|uniref:hypothetical protein n=1 Tax=Candidatus Protochlamydia sp. R18 TaxID=1353977 RepID=UPI0005A9B966|nr:hypothetical protein [Candidatus Protochlamydia sp. R18]
MNGDYSNFNRISIDSLHLASGNQESTSSQKSNLPNQHTVTNWNDIGTNEIIDKINITTSQLTIFPDDQQELQSEQLSSLPLTPLFTEADGPLLKQLSTDEEFEEQDELIEINVSEDSISDNFESLELDLDLNEDIWENTEAKIQISDNKEEILETTNQVAEQTSQVAEQTSQVAEQTSQVAETTNEVVKTKIADEAKTDEIISDVLTKKIEVRKEEIELSTEASADLKRVQAQFKGYITAKGRNLDKTIEKIFTEASKLDPEEHQEYIEKRLEKLVAQGKIGKNENGKFVPLTKEEAELFKHKFKQHFTTFVNTHYAMPLEQVKKTSSNLESKEVSHTEKTENSESVKETSNTQSNKIDQLSHLIINPKETAKHVRKVLMKLAELKETKRRLNEDRARETSAEAEFIAQQILKQAILKEEISKTNLKNTILKDQIVGESNKTTTYLETRLVKTIANGNFTLEKRTQKIEIGHVKIYSANRT